MISKSVYEIMIIMYGQYLIVNTPTSK